MDTKNAAYKRDFGLVIVILRAILLWNRATLSQKSGVDEGLIGDYEQGIRSPFRKTKEKLAAAFGVKPPFLEELVPVCRTIRLAHENAARGRHNEKPLSAESGRRLGEKVAEAVLESMAPFLVEFAKLDVQPAPRPEHRAWAEEQWAALELLPAEDQDKIVQGLLGDERSWALAARWSQASEAVAAHSAAEALRLARLAAAIAKAAPGPEKWLLLLRGFCEYFLANALRVNGTFSAAREAFTRADRLWAQGKDGDPTGLLDATRRLDLKASMLKIDGHVAEALDLLEQALQGAQTDHARGRLLIKRAVTLEISGDYGTALETLRRAEPLIDTHLEPRLPWVIALNLSVDYCHLDRYKEAEALLPRVEALAAALNTRLDAVRTLWLKGRTWAGLGRQEEALAALEDVRRYFRSEKIAYDYALVSLELATLHLEEGRTRLVRDLAEEMAWIFKNETVHQEALAALTLFREAARREKVQAEWTRRMVKYMYRAQGNPRLQFKG